MAFDPRETGGAGAEPLYAQVKRFILAGIDRGEWKPHDRVPSENELVDRFSVSRMTAHRALRELTDEGFLERIAGVGTFVADRTPKGELIRIQNVAEEIARRGHRHRIRVLLRERVSADVTLAQAFEVEPSSRLLHVQVVHFENDVPLQLEDRYVNPEVAPGFLEVDLEHTTSHAYLMQVAPLQEAEHVVEAVLAPKDVAVALTITADEPCLLLTRRTWTHGKVASRVHLYHPGRRYRLGGRLRFT